jgi:hypothetical protein
MWILWGPKGKTILYTMSCSVNGHGQRTDRQRSHGRPKSWLLGGLEVCPRDVPSHPLSQGDEVTFTFRKHPFTQRILLMRTYT